MTLRVVEHHLDEAGMPCSPRGTRARQKGVACHSTESLPGEAATWNVISWMHATAQTRNASYNEFWSADEATQELLAIEVVPDTHAAHSVAPQPFNSSGLPLYAPDALVKAVLGSTVADPNMWVYAIAISGRVADVERYAAMPWFVRDARARLVQLKARGIPTEHLMEHFRFNPRTRSDWGRSLIPALKGADMQYWKPVQEDWMTAIGTKFWDGDGNAKQFFMEHRVTSIAESADGYRLCKFGNELLVVERSGLTPVAGTRIPAPGSYGFPPMPTPVTVTVEKVVEKIVPDPNAVANEQARIRGILGL